MKRRLLVAAVLLALLPAAPARAAPAWLPSEVLSAELATTDGTAVDVNAGGTAIAAFTGQVQFGEPGVLRAKLHAPGGVWTSLTTPAAALPGRPCDPHVAIADSGEATLVWRQFTAPSQPYECDGPATVYGAVLAAGAGAFGAAVPLSESGERTHLALAVNGSGSVQAAWLESASSTPVAIGAASRAPGGAFASVPAMTLSGVMQVADVDVAVDAAGAAAAAWVAQDGFGFDAWAVTRPAGGAWETFATPVSNQGGSVDATDVAVTYDGAALHVLYGERQLAAGAMCNGVLAATSGAVCSRELRGGVWQPAVLVAAAAANHQSDRVEAAAGGGFLAAAWLESGPGSSWRVHVATRAPGAAWSARELSPNDPPTSTGYNMTWPGVAVAPDGSALAAWDSFADGGRYVSFAPPGAGWTQPLAILTGYGAPNVPVFDGAGNALVAVGGQGQAVVRAYDASGPDLVPSIPAAAVAGQPVTVGVQAVDRWSAVVGAPTWSYGDGTAATGETTHVYAQAGTYTVTVTQTDALGNVGSATGSIAVAPPPPPPPPPALGLSSAAFAVTWRASASLGRLVLRGTADEAAQVSGALTRGKFRKPLSFRVPAGPWVVRIALPRTLVPGPYRVLLTGQAAGRPTAPAAGSARLKAPREGVVDDYVISSSRRGPDGASFTRARKLYLRFHFASLPRAGARIRLHIAGPRKLQDVKVLNRRVTIGTDIGNTGRLLPKGRWHFVLRADGRVVKRASVLLR